MCGKNPQKSKGGGKYRALCSPCVKRKYESKDKRLAYNNIKKRPYIVYKKDSCEMCGFLPVHTCQLDVDHINGNHKDNREENLQTLCANCHRLKTYQNQDWIS